MKVKVISLPYIFQVLYVFCFTRPRYQVSVYRTIGPLVLLSLCIQGHLSGYGIEEQLPTVAIVTHYDAFGIAPVSLLSPTEGGTIWSGA